MASQPPYLLEPQELNRTDTSLTLTFDPVENTEYYKVHLGTKTLTLAAEDERVATFDRLSPNTVYTAKLECRLTDNTTALSPEARIHTRPTSPSFVSLMEENEARTANSLRIYWEQSSTAENFIILVNNDEIPAEQNNSSDFTIHNLVPNTLYRISVFAETSIGGRSFSSPILEVRTRPPSPEEAPLNLVPFRQIYAEIPEVVAFPLEEANERAIIQWSVVPETGVEKNIGEAPIGQDQTAIFNLPDGLSGQFQTRVAVFSAEGTNTSAPRKASAFMSSAEIQMFTDDQRTILKHAEDIRRRTVGEAIRSNLYR